MKIDVGLNQLIVAEVRSNPALVKYFKLKIKAYEHRLRQRLYEGSWGAVVESLYAIWFMKYFIGEPIAQGEILRKAGRQRITKKQHDDAIDFNERY